MPFSPLSVGFVICNYNLHVGSLFHKTRLLFLIDPGKKVTLTDNWSSLGFCSSFLSKSEINSKYM